MAEGRDWMRMMIIHPDLIFRVLVTLHPIVMAWVVVAYAVLIKAVAGLGHGGSDYNVSGQGSVPDDDN